MASPDDDVARALVAKWGGSGLPSLVPGGLEQDRLTSSQPGAPAAAQDAAPQARQEPYATFKVEELQEPDLSTGGQYIDHRRVMIEIRGAKDAVGAALDAAGDLYIQQPLLFPTGEFPKVVGGQAMAMLELGADDLRKDTTTKAGEDKWVGTLGLHVMTHRTY